MLTAKGQPYCYASEIRYVDVEDDSPDLSYLTQDYNEVGDEEERQRYLVQDRARLASYGRSWWMIGIQAKVCIYIPLGSRTIAQTIASPCLWGIESDSDEAHFDDAFAQEKETLLSMLSALNVRVMD